MRPLIMLGCITPILLACGEETHPTATNEPLLARASTPSVTVVPPSGDGTGQTDPGAIQAALNAAQPGDVVLLSDGDPSTVDHYYASEGVVVLPGFESVLTGEGPSQTVVHALPRPDGSPFEFTFNSAFINVPGDPTRGIWPTVFHFEYPEAVTVRDLSITQGDPAPSADYFQHIAVWGGNPDVLITGLHLSDPGRTQNSVGIHVMGGSAMLAMDGMGSVDVSQNELDGLRIGVLPMWYGPGAHVDVRGNHFDQGGWDVWPLNDAPSSFHIVDNVFRSTERVGVRLDIVNGVEISGNSFLNGRGAGVLPILVQGADISDNLFRDSYATAFWHANVFAPAQLSDSRIVHNTFVSVGYSAGSGLLAAIEVIGPVVDTEFANNDFVRSGLPGWSSDNPGGPAAVLLAPFTSGNKVHEMQFGPRPGKTVCMMILDLTDDPTTPDYDGANDVRGWTPCGRLAAIGVDLLGGFDPSHGFVTRP